MSYDGPSSRCPRCGEEDETPDHIVFRCSKVRRMKDERGGREWVRENDLIKEVGEDGG